LSLLLAADSLTTAQVGQVAVAASPRQLSLAISLAESADRVFSWPGLGRRSPPRFQLVLVADSAALARLSRGRAPGWGAGVTFPDGRLIILRGDLEGLSGTLHHELAHLMLHDAVPGRLPLWFDEGYAAWASGEADRLFSLQLNLAVASGRVPTLEELDAMLRGSARTADVAYSLAASAVMTLAGRPPPGALERIFARMEAGDDFAASVVAGTGLSVDRFEEEWRKSVRRRYGLGLWLMAGGSWTIVAVILGGLLWHRRRADRPRRAALDVGWSIPEPEPPPVDPGDIRH
jgi:hypothetical protein